MTHKKRIPLGFSLAAILVVLIASISAPRPAIGIESADLEANVGYRAVATQSLSVSSASAVIVGTIPVGCHEVEVIASTSGDVNYGPSTVSSDTSWPYIAAGNQKTFSKLTTLNPKIYFRARGLVATTTAIGIVAK